MDPTTSVRARRKTMTGALTGAAVAALLLGGAGTFALWSDQAQISGGTITAGDLQVAATGGDLKWYATDDVNKTAPIALDTFRMVPGDSLTTEQPVAVALTGDNLKAQLRIGGDMLGDLIGANGEGVSLTYSVLADGERLVEGVPLDERAEVTIGTTAGDGVDIVAPKTLPSTANVKVEITAAFSEETAGRDFTNLTAALGGLTVTLEQVRA